MRGKLLLSWGVRCLPRHETLVSYGAYLFVFLSLFCLVSEILVSCLVPRNIVQGVHVVQHAETGIEYHVVHDL